MNTPLNFELAKLLNKKGLYISSEKRYNKKGTFEYSKSWSVAAPTIADVVMWLYEKHNIWIGVNRNPNFYYVVYSKTEVKDIKNNFNSPTDAYETAIKYSLDKIK